MIKNVTGFLRKFIVLGLVVTMVIGCNSSTSNEDGSSTHDGEEVSYPVTIKDHLDREITFDKEPTKIVSTYYITTSLIIALGLKDKLVGVESNAKSKNIYQLSAPNILDLPGVGGKKDINVEEIAKIKPELLIIPISLKDQIPALEATGIKVIAVNPESDALSNEVMDMIATATNTKARAKEIQNFSDTKLKALNEKLKDVSKKTVYLGGNSDVLSTAGQKMFQNALIEDAHAHNVANELSDTYWAKVSYEQLLVWNPEVIILAPMRKYTKDDVINDSQFKDLKAITNDQVFAMPDDIEAWDSPIPASILGKLWIASMLYPETYSTEDFTKDEIEFYKNFYGFTVKP